MRTLAELACDPGCPVRRSMDALGGKWTLLIVRDLLVERRRFGELLITLGGISPKVLVERLRSLEDGGILTRTVYPEVPLRVEYALTERGRELHPVIDALATWGTRLPAVTGRSVGALEDGDGGFNRVRVDAVRSPHMPRMTSS